MKHITDERRAAMLEDRATLLAWLALTLFAWSKT